MAETEATETGEVTQAAKGGLLENKLVLMAIILAVQGGLGFAVAKFVLAPPAVETQVSQDDDAERERGPLVSLDEMVVSLNATGRARYLRTNISLEAEDAATAAVIEERMAEFRDAAMMKLSRYTPDEMISYEGKEAVKADIKQALKDLMDQGALLNVYFSDFVVQ